MKPPLGRSSKDEDEDKGRYRGKENGGSKQTKNGNGGLKRDDDEEEDREASTNRNGENNRRSDLDSPRRSEMKSSRDQDDVNSLDLHFQKSLSGNNVSSLVSTTASTHCSSSSSSFAAAAAQGGLFMSMPTTTTQDIQPLSRMSQRQISNVSGTSTMVHSNRTNHQQPQHHNRQLSTIIEDIDSIRVEDSTGTSDLRLLFSQARVLGIATVGLFIAFFLFALPLAANIALGTFVIFVGLLSRSLYSLLYTYAIQQWYIIQQRGLANYVPEALRPYVDPQQGTSVHEFMTADGTFVRDHMHLMLYMLPGLTPQQLEFYIRQLPRSRQQVLHQRGMLLPFMPEEAQRVVLGEEGFHRYQYYYQHHGNNDDVAAAALPDMLGYSRRTLPDTDSMLRRPTDDAQEENEQTDEAVLEGDILHQNSIASSANNNNGEDHPPDQQELFLRPWEGPQPSFLSVVREIGRTAFSLFGSSSTEERPQLHGLNAISGTATDNAEEDDDEDMIGLTLDADDEQQHQQERTDGMDTPDMIWVDRSLGHHHHHASDHVLHDDNESSVGNNSTGERSNSSTTDDVVHEETQQDADAEAAQDELVLTNAVTTMIRNYTTSAVLSISSMANPILNYWTPIVGGVGVASSVSWMTTVAIRYPYMMPRWISSGGGAHQFLIAGFRVFGGGFGRGSTTTTTTGRNQSASSSSSTEISITTRSGWENWSMISMGFFSLATLSLGGGMMLLRRQLRIATEQARLYQNETCSSSSGTDTNISNEKSEKEDDTKQ